MTEEELAAIEARAKAATPGPWVVGETWRDHVVDGRFQDGYWPVASQPGMDHEGAWLKGNAAFVAHAREDVPALVAEVRRLRGESDRKWLNMVCDRCHVVFGVMCLPRDREPSPVRCDPCSSAIRERGVS